MMDGQSEADRAHHATLTEEIHARIRHDILIGALRPADKLKLEELKERYDVSVNTLRETLSRLVSEGLVAAEGQRGFMVVPASIADLREIIDVRNLLECHAARLALDHADLEWEGRLVAAYHKLSKVEAALAEDPEGNAPLVETYNRAFHAALISACGSRWLMTLHGMMYDQSLRYRMLSFEVANFPRERSREEHREILDAALARDAERLTRVIAAHILKGADLYGTDGGAADRARAKRKARG